MVKIRTAEFVLVDVDDTRVESLIEELDVEDRMNGCHWDVNTRMRAAEEGHLEAAQVGSGK